MRLSHDLFKDPLSCVMLHAGATGQHVQQTHSTVNHIYNAQQHSHGHATYPLLLGIVRGRDTRAEACPESRSGTGRGE